MSALAEGTLTQAERELLRAFRTTDARGKRTILCYAQGTAKDWPAQRPKLILVPNCGTKVQTKRSRANG